MVPAMTKPAKKIFLSCLVAAVVAVPMVIIVKDQALVNAAEKVKTGLDLAEFEHSSPGNATIEIVHSTLTRIYRYPFVLPVAAREFQFHRDSLKDQYTVRTRVVFGLRPW